MRICEEVIIMLEKKRSANNLISEQLDDHEKRLLMIEENVRNLNDTIVEIKKAQSHFLCDAGFRS